MIRRGSPIAVTDVNFPYVSRTVRTLTGESRPGGLDHRERTVAGAPDPQGLFDVANGHGEAKHRLGAAQKE
ncbi:MAG: hypothetical protein QOF70_2850 [Acetobacteraceae bacterium]|jgi:hypothetical protein|nr:hypothetical protein [Acetobacteraceae bacterium]